MRFDSLYPLVPLGKLVEFINGDRSSNYPKPSDYVDGGIPFISATDIDGGRINLMSAKRISRSAFERLRGGHVRRGDILLCLRGSLGKMGVVQNIDEGAIASSLVILRSHDESILRYVRYVLSGGAGMALLDSLNNGSVQGNISVASLKKMEVPFPPRLEMEAIGSLISMFDMRIDLLLETNASLESISEAFFKSWFIDFDPVRAKAEGREPEGMCADIAALFPSEFVDSELGPIPKGWRVDSIYSFCSVIYGAPFASSKFNSDGVGRPLIRIRDLKDESPGVFTPEEHPKGYLVRPGDIVVGMDGEFRAYLWGGSEAWLNQRVCVFKPKEGVSPAFVRSSIVPRLAEVETTETATTVIHLGKGDIDRFRSIVPDQQVMGAFASLVNPIYAQIVNGKQTAATLRDLRDALLPDLLSGRH